MRRLWRGLRWGAFLLALAVDGALFWTSVPFSPRSYVATGLASLIMFVVFVLLANQVRGRGRIREFLEDNERRVHQTGLHWVRLRANIRQDTRARRAIGYTLLLALVTTLFLAAWGLQIAGQRFGWNAPHGISWAGALFGILPDNWDAFLGYVPLIFAIPFAISHVAEWSSHRYVITPLRVIIHSGIFDYHMHGMLLARVVDVEQDYTFWQQFLNYGDVTFTETAGVIEKLECVWGPKKFAKIATQYSHAQSAQYTRQPVETDNE